MPMETRSRLLRRLTSTPPPTRPRTSFSSAWACSSKAASIGRGTPTSATPMRSLTPWSQADPPSLFSTSSPPPGSALPSCSASQPRKARSRPAVPRVVLSSLLRPPVSTRPASSIARTARTSTPILSVPPTRLSATSRCRRRRACSPAERIRAAPIGGTSLRSCRTAWSAATSRVSGSTRASPSRWPSSTWLAAARPPRGSRRRSSPARSPMAMTSVTTRTSSCT